VTDLAPLAPVTFRALTDARLFPRMVGAVAASQALSGAPVAAGGTLCADSLASAARRSIKDRLRAATRADRAGKPRTAWTDAHELRANVRTAIGDAPSPRSVRFGEADSHGPATAKPLPLDNSQTAFPHLAVGFRDRRRQRWELRRALSRITHLERVKFCGAPIGSAVGLRHSDSAGAGYAGLETCGSVWACPVCASKIGAHRAAELATVLRAARADGYRLGMVTLTIKHKQGDELRALWDTVSGAWTSVISGRPWQRLEAEYDVLGFTRSLEVTTGAHGWHVHIHAMVMLRGDLEGDLGLGEHLYRRWAKAVDRRGFTTSRAGFDARECTNDEQAIADYATKQAHGGLGDAPERAPFTVDSAARESTMSATKVGRKAESRTPFGLLADVASYGTPADVARLPDRERKVAQRDLARWYEWEETSRRRRALTWSKGLREWAKLQEELTDEAIAAEDHGGEAVLTLPRETYLALRRADMLPELLEVTEDAAGSPTAVGEWLTALGLDWSPAPPESRPSA